MSVRPEESRCPFSGDEPVVPAQYVTSPGFDPHAAAARLRERGPVHPIDFPAGSADHAYVVVDHASVMRGFGDPDISKTLEAAPAWFREQTVRSSSVLASNMLLADPPEHTRLRKLVSRAFLPRRMELLRPRVQEITDDLIDAFPETGEFDLLEAFALPLPMMVICAFLGVPYADRDRFIDWGRVLSQDPGQEGEAALERKRVNDQVEEYFTDVLAQRRARPQEDLLGDLVRAADEDDMFTDEELVSTAIFLVIAGHKTTANLVGNGVWSLLRHPEQLELLRANPELTDSAIEEFLRYEGSVDRGTLRTTARDLTLGGQAVPEGSFVHLSVSAANRDPAVFDDPDRFDITRSPNRHMTFGHGPHFCAGAPLARLEGRIAFETLLRRVPDLACTVPPETLPWVADSSISRGLERLPVRIVGKRPRAGTA
ncbi:cytochrome P450 [Streptomyces sp. SID8014]|uniref:cytochrome P450 n=1 Tax=Streptomyces sp. SID8014 TaxID=2706097 RepID=UPI0013B63227|nr:cytochrome P450 [Streptomyces sp. SID8014]